MTDTLRGKEEAGPTDMSPLVYTRQKRLSAANWRTLPMLSM